MAMSRAERDGHGGWGIIGARRALGYAEENRHSHIFRTFLPRLREAGIGDGTIQTMMVDNPRRLFEGPIKAEGAAVAKEREHE